MCQSYPEQNASKIKYDLQSWDIDSVIQKKGLSGTCIFGGMKNMLIHSLSWRYWTSEAHTHTHTHLC